MRHRLARSLPVRQTHGGKLRRAQRSRHPLADVPRTPGLAAHPAPRRSSAVVLRHAWRRWRWCVVVAAALAYAYLAAWLGPQIQAGAGGLLPFDLRWSGYDADEARQFLQALRPEAAALYRGPARLTDTLVPLLLACVLCMPLHRQRPAWALPALCYAVLDLAENVAVDRLLVAGPLVDDSAVALASALTQLKFLAAAVALGIALWSLKTARRR